MKKAGLLLITTILSSIALVSAETNFDAWGRNTASGISKIFENVQLGTFNFTLLLFGILTWMVVYSVIRDSNLFKKYPAIWSGIFALVVTILAFNGFPESLIESIVIQYRAMGATIVTIIPFLIMFWFTIMVSGVDLLISRLIWLIYTIYYFSLYIYKIGSSEASAGLFSLQNLPYIAAILLGLGVLIFLGSLRALAYKQQLDSKKEKAGNKIKKAGAGIDLASSIVDTINDGS